MILFRALVETSADSLSAIVLNECLEPHCDLRDLGSELTSCIATQRLDYLLTLSLTEA